MILIGIGSKARQGKDTMANAIVNYYGYQRDTQQLHGLPVTSPFAVRIGFADALYDVCQKHYGMKNKDAILLQRIGMERRQQDENYWIKRAFEKIQPNHDIVVIPDVRYKNEARFIKDQGGYLISINRMTGTGEQFIDPSRPSDHPSEIDLDDWNFDFRYEISEGHQALTGELGITTAEYLRNLHKN